MAKRKSNIRQQDIGEVFMNKSGNLFRLKDFKPEPQVTMAGIADDKPVTCPLSQFADFVRLKPDIARTRKPKESPAVPPEKPNKKKAP